MEPCNSAVRYSSIWLVWPADTATGRGGLLTGNLLETMGIPACVWPNGRQPAFTFFTACTPPVQQGRGSGT